LVRQEEYNANKSWLTEDKGADLAKIPSTLAKGMGWRTGFCPIKRHRKWGLRGITLTVIPPG
jgi:hypothetical protein